MVLKAFNHENLMHVKAIHLEPKEKFFNIWLVTDLMDFDFNKVIRMGRPEVTEDQIQYIMYQVFLGLYVLHHNNIVHRNLNPQNILLNENCDLKICDFGFRREVPLASGVDIYEGTSNYEAPEIILSSKKYSTEADIWSVGCTFFELLDGKIFIRKIKNDIQFLAKIISLLGSPSDEALEFIQNPNGRKWIKQQKYMPSKKPSSKLTTKTINSQAKDLLDKCLNFDPRLRITAKEALIHPYFADIFLEQDLNIFQLEFDFSFENNLNLTEEHLKQKLIKEVAHLLF